MVQFAGKAISTAVWVGAFSLFMELLGISTQKLLTAGGLGTVLLTLAGGEVLFYFHIYWIPHLNFQSYKAFFIIFVHVYIEQ